MIRFSSDSFPEPERFNTWRGAFLHRMNAELERLDDTRTPFRMDLTNVPLKRLVFAQMRGTPVRMFREQRHVGDGNGDFMLLVSRGAELTAVSGDAQTSLGVIGAALTTFGRPGSVSFRPPREGAYEAYCYEVPRDLLEVVVDNPDRLCFRSAPINRAALEYLVQYTDGLLLKHAFDDPRLVERASTHVLDLVATILGPTREAGETARQRGVRAARLQAMLNFIEANYCNPKLDVEAVAKRHGVSVRYVQRLMETRGETFSNYVLALRLDRVAALLAEQKPAMRIGEIALACGFNDLSYFNRTFKRRFGENPRRFRG